MVNERPQINPLGYYSQADAARLLGVDRHTIARWEKDPRRRLEPQRRKNGGKRYKGLHLLRQWSD